jgi:hypothetical protein
MQRSAYRVAVRRSRPRSNCTSSTIRKPLWRNARWVKLRGLASAKCRPFSNGHDGRPALQVAKCLAFNSFRNGCWGAFSIAPEVQPPAEQRNRKTGAQTTMFLITRDTLRRFPLSEILLLIALNLETSRLATETRTPSATGAALSS